MGIGELVETWLYGYARSEVYFPPNPPTRTPKIPSEEVEVEYLDPPKQPAPAPGPAARHYRGLPGPPQVGHSGAGEFEDPPFDWGEIEED